jgi:S1-C subfamily serine protease
MRIAVCVGVLALLVPSALADEGMWTFDNFPSAKVKQAYGFAPDRAWLDRIQKSSVRLDGGCSGSVVSKDGLVLTNHHCIADCVQNLSSARNDLLANGFLAASRKEERICPGGEASILQSITDVTQRVRDAVAGVSPDQLSRRRAQATAEIEREACGDDRNRRCEVVSLYRGGQYKLYRYDRYQDVRLAFAPEQQAAFFGGDPDNFNFPRYAYDMSLIRLYRDGKPVSFKDYLRVDPQGPSEGDLVFTSGHPGSTERLLTLSQLAFQRDHFLPWRIEYSAQFRGALLNQSSRGEEEARQANEALFGIENSIKVFKGQRGALVEPDFFGKKAAEEKRLRDALAARPELIARYGDPFAEVEAVVRTQSRLWLPYQMLESRLGAGSVLLTEARLLLRGAAERSLPDTEKLPEFSPSRLASTERSVLAEIPVHPSLEQMQIEYWLLKTREYLGADHPVVKDLFAGRSAADIAREIATRSQLGDPAVRRRLWEAPQEALASSDPAFALIRRVDAAGRAARKAYEAQVSGPLSAASEKIASLRFDVLGDQIYPDATFSLRLSYGVVKGWNDPLLGPVGAFTLAKGLWERATGAAPFNLAPKWAAAAGKVASDVKMNFVSTNDIIGGNSGSPLLNKDGKIVGLVFDGNIHSLGGAYGFDENLNRAVSVASPILLEALERVYGASSLVAELKS